MASSTFEPPTTGANFAGRLFDLTPAVRRPRDHAGVVDLLAGPVRAPVELAAPLETDPPITASKGLGPANTNRSRDMTELGKTVRLSRLRNRESGKI